MEPKAPEADTARKKPACEFQTIAVQGSAGTELLDVHVAPESGFMLGGGA